jgi:hypothetical protein
VKVGVQGLQACPVSCKCLFLGCWSRSELDRDNCVLEAGFSMGKHVYTAVPVCDEQLKAVTSSSVISRHNGLVGSLLKG